MATEETAGKGEQANEDTSARENLEGPAEPAPAVEAAEVAGSTDAHDSKAPRPGDGGNRDGTKKETIPLRLDPPRTPVEDYGFLLALILLGMILLTIIAVACLVLFRCEPHPQQLDVKTAIELHKQWIEIHTQAATSLFETVVIKVLLPVLTAILGYIFGQKK